MQVSEWHLPSLDMVCVFVKGLIGWFCLKCFVCAGKRGMDLCVLERMVNGVR